MVSRAWGLHKRREPTANTNMSRKAGVHGFKAPPKKSYDEKKHHLIRLWLAGSAKKYAQYWVAELEKKENKSLEDLANYYATKCALTYDSVSILNQWEPRDHLPENAVQIEDDELVSTVAASLNDDKTVALLPDTCWKRFLVYPYGERAFVHIEGVNFAPANASWLPTVTKATAVTSEEVGARFWIRQGMEEPYRDHITIPTEFFNSKFADLGQGWRCCIRRIRMDRPDGAGPNQKQSHHLRKQLLEALDLKTPLFPEKADNEPVLSMTVEDMVQKIDDYDAAQKAAALLKRLACQ